jgi:hypothetical protein
MSLDGKIFAADRRGETPPTYRPASQLDLPTADRTAAASVSTPQSTAHRRAGSVERYLFVDRGLSV